MPAVVDGLLNLFFYNILQVDLSVSNCNSCPSTPISSRSGSVDGSCSPLPTLPRQSTPLLSNGSTSSSPSNSRSSSPMLFNDKDSSFSGTEEVSRRNTQWVQNFELPSMVCWIVMHFDYMYFNPLSLVAPQCTLLFLFI